MSLWWMFVNGGDLLQKWGVPFLLPPSPSEGLPLNPVNMGSRGTLMWASPACPGEARLSNALWCVLSWKSCLWWHKINNKPLRLFVSQLEFWIYIRKEANVLGEVLIIWLSLQCPAIMRHSRGQMFGVEGLEASRQPQDRRLLSLLACINTLRSNTRLYVTTSYKVTVVMLV